MKELQIIISGEAGAGKTTIMLLLEEFLKEKGFNIEVDLENELIDYGTEFQFRAICGLYWQEKVKKIKTERKIILKTMQMNRDCSKKD